MRLPVEQDGPSQMSLATIYHQRDLWNAWHDPGRLAAFVWVLLFIIVCLYAASNSRLGVWHIGEFKVFFHREQINWRSRFALYKPLNDAIPFSCFGGLFK